MDLRLENLGIQHMADFLDWGYFEDPLLAMYNFQEEAQGLEDWYRWKTRRPWDRYQAILLGQRAIGYVGLKNFNPLTRRGELGIILDPNYVDQGYGTWALRLFLREAFLEGRARQVYLLVLPWNARAIHVYKKLGFKEEGTHWTGVFFPLRDRLEEALVPYEKSLRRLGALSYVKAIRMHVEREDMEEGFFEL
ncbi:MAG: GNAT family N-acetyltransferase [Tissierellia bacterium]|nr:GNAT family N-acetyltransferase [Tissierellia bacterium]